ncbi:AAA domain-containing protein [Archangium sp.]|uniref:AAA domain-containing protein n=1 Tax=Archangium sp. TaxID=1872627 RepID=UPI00286BECBD|nr:AAA domain-containing protein [Archangium sp.]
MLANRIALYAESHGLPAPRSLEYVRLGLVDCLRVSGVLPVALTGRARTELEELGLSIEDILNEGDIWARVEVRNQGPESLDGFIREGVLPEECSIVLVAQRAMVRVVPWEDALGVVQVSTEPPRHRPATLLVARFVEEEEPSFDPLPLFQVLANRERLSRIASRKKLEQEDREDRHFLAPYRRYVEDAKEYLIESTPTAPYQLASRDPVSVTTQGPWRREFTIPETLVKIPTEIGFPRTFKVEEVNEEGDVLILDDSDPDLLLKFEGELEIKPNTGPFDRMLEAMEALASGTHLPYLTLVQALRAPERLAPLEPVLFQPLWLRPRNQESERQYQAVETALGCQDICLVHGPPGTGKTTVICELILQLLANNQRVLLVAPTHVALDNVLMRIGDAPGVVAIRLGRSARADERVQKHLLPKAAGTLGEKLRGELDQAVAGAPEDDAVARVQREWLASVNTNPEATGSLLLLNANLLCATPIGIAMRREFRDLEPLFDVMIMDEASKATVADFLVPATRAKRWILVGDHRQLAPYADMEELAAIVQRAKYRLGGKPSEEWCQDVAAELRKHFDQRMHPSEEVRRQRWHELVETVMEEDADLVRLEAIPPEEGRWHQLWQDLKAGRPLPEGMTLPEEKRAEAGRRAQLMHELLELQRVSMPGIFERLLALPESRKVRLNYQQRMAPALAEFSKCHVYDKDYPSASGTQRFGLGDIHELEAPSIWIDTQLAPTQLRYESPRDQNWTGGHYYNELELRIALEVVERCIDWGARSWREVDAKGQPLPLELGIISFYGEQAERLRKEIFRRFAESEGRWRRVARRRAANGQTIDLHVSVVDRFQGQEKDIVILSGTRSNPIRNRGHVNNLNRLNVAVTRARHKRILIGDGATLTRRDKNGELVAGDLLSELMRLSDVKVRWGKALRGETT